MIWRYFWLYLVAMTDFCSYCERSSILMCCVSVKALNAKGMLLYSTVAKRHWLSQAGRLYCHAGYTGLASKAELTCRLYCTSALASLIMCHGWGKTGCTELSCTLCLKESSFWYHSIFTVFSCPQKFEACISLIFLPKKYCLKIGRTDCAFHWWRKTQRT